MRIDERTAEILQPWFPTVPLGVVRLIEGGPVCWLVCHVLHQGAMTFSPFVFFGRHHYDPTATSSVALLAHELKHVEQYRRYGHAPFLFRYFRELARNGFRYDRALPLEAECYALQAEVAQHLTG